MWFKESHCCFRLIHFLYSGHDPKDVITLFLLGERYCTINVHNLIHYVKCVRIHGPAWASLSAFEFESWNSDFKYLFHGTQGIEQQVGVKALKYCVYILPLRNFEVLILFNFRL